MKTDAVMPPVIQHNTHTHIHTHTQLWHAGCHGNQPGRSAAAVVTHRLTLFCVYCLLSAGCYRIEWCVCMH